MVELTNLPKDIAIVGSWFYEYYEDALEDNDYYHAVKYARNNMISLLHY
jgi:hypothetical protein